jgi:hypothetical protein
MSDNNEIVPLKKEKKSRRSNSNEVKYNEKGERLNKDGKTVDKRQFQSKKNLEKSTVYQAVQAVKKKQKSLLDDPVESDSESEASEEEDEFEIEQLIVKPKGEPQVVEVEKIVVHEVLKEDPIKDQKLRKLEENNKILNDKFAQISHLNRMETLNRSITIKR